VRWQEKREPMLEALAPKRAAGIEALKRHTASLTEEQLSARGRQNNRMHLASSRAKVSQTHLAIGKKPPTPTGWNGAQRGVRGVLTRPQAMLLEALGEGWQAEFVMNCGKTTGYPTYYGLDLAHPDTMTCVEIDGKGHSAASRKALDRKKEAFLLGLGWKVLRFSNKEILRGVSDVVKTVRLNCGI